MISVIVPVFKVEPYLRECIDSILNQTYRDLDIILIDDGSPDSCGLICDEYARKDSRVSVVHTENKGLSSARNTGIALAKGEYIGFVDSDDWIEPNMYAVLLQRMEKSNADVVVGRYWSEAAGEKKQVGIDQDIVISAEQAVRWIIFGKINNLAWNKLYKRECWSHVKFPENCVFEDVSTTYRTFFNAKRIATSSECIYHYRIRKNGISSTVSMTNMRDYWRAFYARYEELKSIPDYANDPALMNRSLYLIAIATSQNWRWIRTIPKADRDYDHLRTVSRFNRENYPVFGMKDWELHLRLTTFLARYVNGLSFFTANALFANSAPTAHAFR